MFDKSKAQFEKFQEDHEAVRRTVQHLKDNKSKYQVGACCFVAGAVGMKFIGQASSPDIIQTISGRENIGTIVNRSKNVEVVINYLNVRGYVSKAVRCIETGEEWASQIEAALANGGSATDMSHHLNGKNPHFRNMHFERIVPDLA